MFLKKIIIVLSFFLPFYLNAEKIDENECSKKAENFIFAGGECIEYRAFKGEVEDSINIIVHGTWKEGTNTLGRYAPFAENINMQTDITTIAVSLPGYSGSSTNNFTALAHEGVKNLGAKKEYIEFLGDLVKKLKDKYNASKVNYIGHSAGAMMGATLTGIRPGLIQNIALAGGRYNIHEKNDTKGLISIVDVLNSVNKDTVFLLIYGTKDKISEPKITKDFYNLVTTKGFNAKLIEVKDAVHLDLDMTDTSVEAIVELVEE